MPALPSVPSLRRNFFLQLSPWLMVGLALILGLVIAVLAARNTQREKLHMSETLTDRAKSLIWALEAGTRTWMGMSGGRQHLQALLEETSKQPSIAFVVVTNAEGLVLAHSDKSKIGTHLYEAGAMAALGVAAEEQWRVTDSSGEGKVFEVYRFFSPQAGFHHEMWDTPKSDCTDCAPGSPSPKASGVVSPLQRDRQVIFVGLDVRPFEAALAEDFRNTVVIALLVGLLGFGGFVSLFWAQSYRKSRRLLQDARAFSSEVVTNLPLGLLASDPDGHITLANEAASGLLGVSPETLAGMPLHDIGGLDWASLITALSQDEVVLEREMEFVSRQGKLTPVSLSASRIVNEDGFFLGHLFILRDLGEIKRLQDQVRRNERLSALGNLAAGVAHEIRNPLSSIKGFATYLAGKIKTEGPDKEAAKVMIQEVDRLNRVVSELLEFAKPGQPVLKHEDINAVVERALRLAGSDASAKGIAVRFKRDDSLPLPSMDAERLTQALLNLFLNAIQSMEQGGVLEVTAFCEGSPRRLAVRIVDTGKGMPKDVLANIFNPYFTTKSSGTGLGLAIVHRIVEGHGGEIKVESQPGQGTTFTILLPLEGQAG